MVRRKRSDDDWESDGPEWGDGESSWDHDNEEDDDDFNVDDDDNDTIPCPHCRREIHEDAQRCPYCEHYLSEEDTPSRPKPWWVVVGLILCLLAVCMWLAG